MPGSHLAQSQISNGSIACFLWGPEPVEYSVHFHWCLLVPSTKTKGGPLWPPSIWLHLQSPGKRTRALHLILLSMQGWVGKANWAEQGRTTLKAALPSNDSCFWFRCLHNTSHHACQSPQQEGWGGQLVGKGKQRHHSNCLPLAHHSLYVRGLCFSVLIIHFPEVSQCEGTRHASSWFP